MDLKPMLSSQEEHQHAAMNKQLGMLPGEDTALYPQQGNQGPAAKKQSKWSPKEDAKIIQLRQDGMKWEDISKHLPGRSAISCRLHYQNYLEKNVD